MNQREHDASPRAQDGALGPQDDKDVATPGPDAPRSHILARSRVWLIRSTLILLALLTLGALFAATQIERAPRWWRHLRPDDDRVVAGATAIENQLGRELHRLRSIEGTSADGTRQLSVPWALEVSDLDASRWLTGRLPRWLETETGLDEWPEELSQMQVRFVGGEVRVGVRLGAKEEEPGSGRVVTASLKPEIRSDGSLWVKPTWVHVGRLPLPAPMVLREARANAADFFPDELEGVDLTFVEKLFEIALGEEAVNLTPELRLVDRRRVRLLDVRVDDGVMRVVCRTESAAVATR
ncbi:MAG: hypothetical protein AAGI17_06910 [Planctomycetota bacterium]